MLSIKLEIFIISKLCHKNTGGKEQKLEEVKLPYSGSKVNMEGVASVAIAIGRAQIQDSAADSDPSH